MTEQVNAAEVRELLKRLEQQEVPRQERIIRVAPVYLAPPRWMPYRLFRWLLNQMNRAAMDSVK